MSEARFGKYAVLTRIGVGGMAEVFQCRMKGLGGFDKLVVVKRILSSHLGEEEFVEMFLDEARIAASLNHSNIIQIFEVDQIGGVPYIAMEFVRGPTLAVLLRQAQKKSALHLGHAAKILSGVCAGLHHAHTARDARGDPLSIVHRDVSPENILVSEEGVPKLLDFGVAKARGKMTTTDPGQLRGKLRFMAPELLRGEPAEARSDIFAVGACLYEATVGRSAFGANSEPELASAVLRGAITAPSEIAPDYPAELERIVLWAMHPDRAKRCPSAMALREALEHFTGAGAHASSSHAVAAWVAEIFRGAPHVGDGVYGATPSRPAILAQPPLPPSDAGILAPRSGDAVLESPEFVDAEPDPEAPPAPQSGSPPAPPADALERPTREHQAPSTGPGAAANAVPLPSPAPGVAAKSSDGRAAMAIPLSGPIAPERAVDPPGPPPRSNGATGGQGPGRSLAPVSRPEQTPSLGAAPPLAPDASPPDRGPARPPTRTPGPAPSLEAIPLPGPESLPPERPPAPSLAPAPPRPGGSEVFPPVLHPAAQRPTPSSLPRQAAPEAPVLPSPAAPGARARAEVRTLPPGAAIELPGPPLTWPLAPAPADPSKAAPRTETPVPRSPPPPAPRPPASASRPAPPPAPRPATNAARAPEPRPSGARRALLPLVVIAAVVGVFVLLLRPGAKPAEALPTSVVRGYLAQAEKLAGDREYGQALALLEKARAGKPSDAALWVDIGRMEKACALAMGEDALKRGDLAGAREASQRVLAIDPDNAGGQELARRATGAPASPQAAAAPTPAPVAVAATPEPSAHPAAAAPPEPEKVAAAPTKETGPQPTPAPPRPGALSISSQPEALIAVDGAPAGTTPLASLPVKPGEHLVEARAEGFLAQRRKVKVESAEDARVAFKLVPIRRPEPVARAEPRKEPPRPEPARPETPNPDAKKPASPPAASAEVDLSATKLPAVYFVKSARDLARVCTNIENEAIAAGVAGAVANGVTEELQASLEKSFDGARPVEFYPKGMYGLIVAEARAGRDKASIRTRLSRSHAAGTLRRD